MKPTKGERFLEAFNDIDEKYLKEAMNYTMKKRFNFKPIIAVAACAALALAAVPVAKHFAGNPLGTQGTTVTTEAPSPIVLGRNLTVLYAGGSADSSSGIIIEKETEFDGIDTQFKDKTKVGTKQTVTISGVTYTGTYVDSTRSDYYGDDTDNYSARVDGKIVDFSINRATGIVTSVLIDRGTLSIGKKLTREECYTNAIKYLKAFVDDIEDYTLTDTFDQGTSLGYLFRLYRIVNGIKTSDCIDIRVNHQGEVCRYSLYSIGEMKNIDISTIDIKNMDAAISNKINTLYKNYRNINFSTENTMFARLANGKYAFIYDVSVSGTNEGKAFTNFDKIVVEVE